MALWVDSYPEGCPINRQLCHLPKCPQAGHWNPHFLSHSEGCFKRSVQHKTSFPLSSLRFKPLFPSRCRRHFDQFEVRTGKRERGRFAIRWKPEIKLEGVWALFSFFYWSLIEASIEASLQHKGGNRDGRWMRRSPAPSNTMLELQSTQHHQQIKHDYALKTSWSVIPNLPQIQAEEHRN